MPIHQIEIKQLCKSTSNVRKTNSKVAQEELKASILSHGLMQNLVVTDAGDGNYHVIAGARRLEALQALQTEGKLAADYAAPCQIVTDEQAVEMSLAENTVRQAMHPADEFEAFAALSDQGQTASQIAERFGKTEKHVLQRLKLGRVAPELVEEYRAEKLTLESLEAFTVIDDRKRQLDLYRGLQGWQKDSATHIRRCLTEQMTDADSKLAKFVTLEAYEAAGGTTKTDLFGEDVYLEDTALLHRLAGEKLEAEAEALRSDGWGWVEVALERDYSVIAKHGRIQPVPLNAPAYLVADLQGLDTAIEALDAAYEATDEEDEDALASLDEEGSELRSERQSIKEQLASYTDFLPLEKKLAGCFVSIGWGGKLDIEKGLVKPEDKKAVAKAQPDANADDEPDDKPGLSQALIDDLKRYRTQVAQVAFAENPTIAFDLLVFQAARDELGNSHSFDGPQVSFQNQYLKPSVEPDTAATEQLEAIRDELPLAWLKEKTEPQQFAAFRKLADEDKHRLLAYCTAMTLQAKLAPGEGKQKSAYDTALGLTGVDVAGYWRPTAANFLSRIKREQLLEIGQEVLMGGDYWSVQKKDAKKADLVMELDGVFNKSGAAAPEAIVRWLPEGMAIAKPEPVAVKAKKGKAT